MRSRPNPSRSPELERIGSALGPYRLVTPLGAGGMATVFSAVHVGLEKRVAVKVLRERLVVDADLKTRFTREGVIASRVRHPHVVDVTDVGEDRGHVYLVLELLEGESLAARMSRQGSMPVTGIVDIVLPIIAALGAAHRAGIVHRDVKPENIFLARVGDRHEVPKLLDFGISRVFGHTLLTDEHTILGTAHYMAPEQARAERTIDGRADQYALAIVVFEAICGQLPYVTDSANVLELLAEAAHGQTVSLASRWKSAPDGLSDVLSRALARARDDRFAEIEDLGRALAPFASANGARRFRELVDPVTTEAPAPASMNGVRVEAPTIAADLASSPSEPPGTTRRTRKPTLRGVVPSHRLPSLPSVPREIPASERPLAPFPVPRLDRAWRLAPLFALALASTGVAYDAVAVRDDVAPPVRIGSTAPAVRAAPAEPEAVSVNLDVQPAYAVISIDGRPTAVGAMHALLPRTGERHRVTVDADGFVRWEAYVEDTDLERAIALRPRDD
jgi:serine/threonine-protein kinase